MSVKVEETSHKSVDQVAVLRQKCAACFKGANLVKTVVVVVCVGVVVQQIISCIQKLTNIPITTHTHFDFNKTIQYPSVTFCREPPYKSRKLEEYGLYSHPRFTSTWRDFNFTRISLQDLWEEITYNVDDYFVQYGLDSYRNNVEVTATLGFVTGRCYTLTPRRKDIQASKARGYSVTLQHAAEDLASATSVLPPGYHVHIHYEKEPYTEVDVYNGGLVDYLYINTGETLDVKLSVNQYAMISDEQNPCTDSVGYSANYCTSKYVWDEVGKVANCSGPWMNISLPPCNNFQDMRILISSYMDKYIHHNCEVCPRICRSLLYGAFVTDRQKHYTWDDAAQKWAGVTNDAKLQTQIFIHFNNMMVSVFEEKYNYDWNLFVSDLGGSVGFLLGLSVIGLISILGKLWTDMLRPLVVARTPSPAPPAPPAPYAPTHNAY